VVYRLVSAPQPQRVGTPDSAQRRKTISVVTSSNSRVCGSRHRSYRHPASQQSAVTALSCADAVNGTW